MKSRRGDEGWMTQSDVAFGLSSIDEEDDMWARTAGMPASMFGIVLGLVGFGNDWRAAKRMWGLPAWPGETIMLLAVGVWLALILSYGLKWTTQRDAAVAESRHPIQCCYIALVPVSTMLIGLAVLPYSLATARVLICVGAAAMVTFGVWRHAGLWRGGRSMGETTPVLYLPTVAGNFVAATTLGALSWSPVGQVFFGAGALAWLAVESVILQRLLVADEMPASLRPTLGIQLAPPAVGLLAYTSVTSGPPTLLASMLLGYALLQGLFMLRLLPWIGAQPFGAGYWGFSFGLTAMTLAVERLSERGMSEPFLTLAPVLFTIANLVLLLFILGTVWLLVTGRLFPASPARVTAPST